MNEKKKKNSYLRMGIILFCAMLVGGVIGFGGRVMIDSIGEGIGTCMQALIELIQKYMLPLLLIILILTDRRRIALLFRVYLLFCFNIANLPHSIIGKADQKKETGDKKSFRFFCVFNILHGISG